MRVKINKVEKERTLWQRESFLIPKTVNFLKQTLFMNTLGNASL